VNVLLVASGINTACGTWPDVIREILRWHRRSDISLWNWSIYTRSFLVNLRYELCDVHLRLQWFSIPLFKIVENSALYLSPQRTGIILGDLLCFYSCMAIAGYNLLSSGFASTVHTFFGFWVLITHRRTWFRSWLARCRWEVWLWIQHCEYDVNVCVCSFLFHPAPCSFRHLHTSNQLAFAFVILYSLGVARLNLNVCPKIVFWRSSPNPICPVIGFGRFLASILCFELATVLFVFKQKFIITEESKYNRHSQVKYIQSRVYCTQLYDEVS
jgi:hypothetical protein